MRTVGLKEYRQLQSSLDIKNYVGFYANPDNTFSLFERGDEELYQKLIKALESRPKHSDKLPLHELLEGEVAVVGPQDDRGFVSDEPAVVLKEEEKTDNTVTLMSEDWEEWKASALEKLNKKTTNLQSVRKLMRELLERIN